MILNRQIPVAIICGLFFAPGFSQNNSAAKNPSPQTLPITEVLIFKNGYAFVNREGGVNVANDTVVLGNVPQAVLGSFWAYVRDQDLQLRAVSAGNVNRVNLTPAIRMRDLLNINSGRIVTVSEVDEVQYVARIEDVPEHLSEEKKTIQPAAYYDYRLQRNIQPPPYMQMTSQRLEGDFVIFDVQSGSVPKGMRIVPIGRILDVTFSEPAEPPPNMQIETIGLEPRLRLDLTGRHNGSARVGAVYLARGLRWIPEYALLLGDENKIRVRMQATLINDLEDLSGVQVRLVIGVPSFAFAGSLSPLSLADAFDRLSPYFGQPGAAPAEGNSVAGNLRFSAADALMSQSESISSFEQGIRGGAGIAIGGGDAQAVGPQEDLFIYELEPTDLKKNHRMIVPIMETELTYEDRYIWDLAAFPPAEVMQNMNAQQKQQLMQLLTTHSVRHIIRFTNESQVPLTTGAALVLQDGNLIAQSLLSYTSIGSFANVDLTAATDIKGEKSEREVERTANAIRFNNHDFTKIDMNGEIKLTNFKNEPVTVEVRRVVLGEVTAAGSDGAVEFINMIEDSSARMAPGKWFMRYSQWNYWPNWWWGVNRMSRIEWEIELTPGETRTLDYDYSYFVY